MERRFGALQVTGSYVFSKSLGLMTYRQIFSQGAQVQTQDSYNIPDAKGLSFFDIPHFVNILTSYQLPFGRGKKFFGNANRVTNLLVGGWAIAGAQQYRSGTLLQIQTTGNPLGQGVIFSPITKANASGKPIRTGLGATDMDPNDPNSRWFNYGADSPFTAAPAYTLGSTAMYHPQFRNPWYRNENVSFQKDFAFTERFRLRYRADIINLFNRSDLGNINVNVGNANFGRPQSPMVAQRYISMGVRAEF